MELVGVDNSELDRETVLLMQCLDWCPMVQELLENDGIDYIPFNWPKNSVIVIVHRLFQVVLGKRQEGNHEVQSIFDDEED